MIIGSPAPSGKKTPDAFTHCQLWGCFMSHLLIVTVGDGLLGEWGCPCLFVAIKIEKSITASWGWPSELLTGTCLWISKLSEIQTLSVNYGGPSFALREKTAMWSDTVGSKEWHEVEMDHCDTESVEWIANPGGLGRRWSRCLVITGSTKWLQGHQLLGSCHLCHAVLLTAVEGRNCKL